MQNFSNSPTPHTLAPGFGMRSGGGPSYPPQPAEPQLSPRMAEDYAAIQQQSLHRSHPHSSQASPMLAYNARNRGVVEPPTQANIHSSSNNPYRKDTMDYYFSLGAKDKNRRGGLVYGTGFGYPNIDGHIPPQYRHSASGSVLSSGIMSQYSVDYGPSTGSGGASGAFSPHQYNMSQNAAMQAMPASQSRQHGQTFSPVHHGQQHRSYPSSGHRMTPQYPQYSPQPGVSTGSSGMYSPPPQRYVDGTANTGFDPKINSSHSVNSSANSVSGSAAANNMGPVESVQQRYHAANFSGYIPQMQMLHKEGTLQHCNTQHNLGVGFENPVKMQHQSPNKSTIYGKHQQASTPSIPHTTSQELAKSPMHPQQSQINQNLSPISNPSPAASAVHSPSCRSTPSPLLGVSETYVNTSGHSNSSSTVHSSSRSHRLIQAVSQLSPTPNSNSSISSCGSNGSHKGHNISNIGLNSVPPTSCNKSGLGSTHAPREEGPCSYSSPTAGKIQDAGLNSLNALSSQVANLPNTIQHMLRTDNVFSQKKGKDGGQVQQTAHSVSPLEPRSRNASTASSTGTLKDGTIVGIAESAGLETVANEDASYMSAETKTEQEDHLIEGHQRMRQMSGASNYSKDLSSLTEAFGKRGQAIGTKGQEDISQIHHFPSLLQEVLQGYNLDRRYGRPEQAFPAHLQVQQQFQTRYPYGMTENIRMVDTAASGTLGQVGTTGKPLHPNNRNGSKTNFATGPQSSIKPEASNTKGTLPHHKAHGPNTNEHEEAKPPCFPPPYNDGKPQTDVTSTQPRVQRQTKSGGPAETNPLILRRRVRSFISPIPAKRLLQDPSQQRAATNSHLPVVPSDSNHHNEDESTSSDIPQLTSPLPGDNAFKSLSPSSGNIKALPPKKGRGLKLEAIVQKISPSVTKSAGNIDDGTSHYPGFSNATVPPFTESQDQEINHFPRVTGGDDCFDDVHSLNDMIPFRGVDETGPLPLSAYPCDPQTRRQKDFDFGLGASVVSASGEKEDFALLGPLPPPPPLPRPVQGSPPPSSSALSDIQHFTNTYQQLETRRGEQSAANLLRQKIQESGIGFDDYTGSDYYRATSPRHSLSQGHVLSRHQMSSPRPNLSAQDCKTPENAVPKGYFPSGKKKGRPVGSVNKQKRAQGQTPIQSQTQAQNMNPNSQLPPISITAGPTIPDAVETTSTVTSIIENKTTPPLTPPILTQVVKMDVESEPIQPEIDIKPVRRRRKGLNDEDESPESRQRIRRGGAPASQSVARDNPEIQLGAKGPNSTNRAFLDANLKGLFVPHIHVENKIPEIGSVCTIVNAEDDKLKGERGMRETDQAESSLQSGKTLPSSGYVVSGPTLTETKHSGRQLCCLCKKWANYKHLGDLYGPYYPAEYAAKLPKNQPQTHAKTPLLACRENMIGETSTIASSYTTNKPLSWEMIPDIRPIPDLKRERDFDVEQQPVPMQLQGQPADEGQQRPQHRKLTSHPRFKRRHKSSEKSPRMVPSNSKASLPFQPPPPALDSLGPLAQLAQLPQMPMDPEELWVHEGCIVWTSGVYLVNGRLYGLQEALDGARETSCSYCEMVGSTLGCYSKGCIRRYHYLCAIETDCSLNEDNFSLRCPKHKVK
nr:transcription factor 20-like [Nerophis lumbriciformis]